MERDALLAVRTLLEYIGEDPDRPGLQETPARVVKALREIFSGYPTDVGELVKTFPNGDDDGAPEAAKYNGIVLLRDIDYYSMCEHHMLPFFGKAHIAYIPGEDGRVIGVSKLARIVDAFARRLQVQERMTAQIADALVRLLKPKGVLVVVEGQHLCMLMRGVRKANSVMVTSEVRGLFLQRLKAKEEVLQLLLRR